MDIYRSQSDLLKTLAHATRLAILDVLRDGEQCVCHLEATLRLRQAYISQQLMILKQAGLIEARRDGLNLYYRVIRPEIFNVIDASGSVVGVAPKRSGRAHDEGACPCPKCNPNAQKEIREAPAVV